MAKTKKKRRLNIRGLLVILLVLYLIGSFLYYIINLPIKTITINGTSKLSDVEIIETAKIKDYPAIFKLNTSKMKKNLKKLDLVADVKIKRNVFGNITIDITEEKILFLNRNKNKIVLANGSEIENNANYYGYPILINYVPDTILKDFIEKLTKIDDNILSLISEIEYSPEKLDDLVLNENRFLLRMNDTNTVFVDTINLDKLNNYHKYFATINDDVRGIFYLDSNRGAVSFNSYEDALAGKEESEVPNEEELQ